MNFDSEKLAFLSDIGNGYVTDYEVNLYNHPAHLRLLDEEITSFFIAHPQEKKLLGQIHFVMNEGVATSLPRRPFGSFELPEEIRVEKLRSFIDYISEEIKKRGGEQIEIRGFAPLYQPKNFARIAAALVYKGFAVAKVDMNYHLEVDEQPFADRIGADQKRRLNAAQRNGFSLSWDTADDLEEIYGFVAACRREKNFPMTIDLEQLRRSFETFPKAYRLCTVRRRGEIAAAGLFVQVRKNILYDFLLASPVKFSAFSPTLTLINGAYELCQLNGCRYLDLGIASIDNRLQEGVARFKENIGGIPSVKLSFAKKMA